MEIIPYTPDLYEQLILFLVESFPNRDKRYFDWWLKQYSCEKNLLNRTFLVEDKGMSYPDIGRHIYKLINVLLL